MYEDERVFIQSQIRHLLNLLQSGEIMWILLSAKNNKAISVELTYSVIYKNIEIKYRNGNKGFKEIDILKKLGAIEFDCNQNLNIIRSPVNAKIITDVLCVVFEKFFEYKPVVNLNIKTSGD